MFRTALMVVSTLALGQFSAAQEAEYIPPALCSEDAFDQFDFWLGEWDVETPEGNFVGNNSVTLEEEGCLILETWTSENGGTGQSYNFYNPATEKWRQIWVGQGSLIDYEGGLTETGSMKLEGVITYVSTGATADFTGEWTPNEDGSITQHFEQYDADAEQWTPWFTGLLYACRNAGSCGRALGAERPHQLSSEGDDL